MTLRIDKKWPTLDEATHLGRRIERLDGPDKVSGRAKYTYDIHRPNMVWAKFVLSPQGHQKVVSIDLEPAKKVKGCVYTEARVEVGAEINNPGDAVALVAGDTEEAAREAARRVVVKYESLPHNHQSREVGAIADAFKKPGRERTEGDVDAAFAAAAATIEGFYGCEIITHCCLESHGVVVELEGDDKLTVWISTQNVSGTAEGAANTSDVSIENIHVICHHLGGGFGSKFGFDCGPEALKIARKLGRPVKLMMERDQELMIAGSRPSAFAKVKVAADASGKITAWDSMSWATDGFGARARVAIPYVFRVPNSKTNNISIVQHTAPARAWRAPGHPQQCHITMSALEDLAAKLGMDPVEFFKANLDLTGRPQVYAEQLDIAASMIDWKNKWKPRGSSTGVVKRGLGLALHTWGGGGHDSNNEVMIRSDGTVETRCGTQDLGVGVRTSIGIVVADCLSLPMDAVKVLIGENRYPPSGASGGSSTIGGIATAARTAAVDAVNQLIAKVAPLIGMPADMVVPSGGKLVAKNDPTKSIAWADACKSIGPQPIVGKGRRDEDLMSSDVGGVQMAEVEVDSETGVVTMKKMVAVQDCGTIVNLMAAESQVYGGCIMGITSALYEERIQDPVTGACLNPDMEFYRLAGIKDVGEIQVHMMMKPDHFGRGVIGLGEPPVISPLGAISNALANALGIRVPVAPFTPREVLRALGKGGPS
jgi:xanthine dehydrogenase YagR molybdenum-binding subunit